MTLTATAAQPGIAVHPGQPNSLHMTEIPRQEPGPGEVRIRIRQVGVCGTDREIIHGGFGRAPEGDASLVIGHEMLGEIDAVGGGVAGFAPRQLVTATVRRPDGCPACEAGQPDMCQWLHYAERGIVGLHGYMTEAVVEAARWVVPVPPALAEVGILVEPISVVEKALRQAMLVQKRIVSWQPKTALVLGAGPIGLAGTLLLRSRGVDVVTVARRPGPHLASEIVEATGSSEPGFAAMEILGNNGVLVLLSGTGGNRELTVPSDAINRSLLRGNKVVLGCVNSAKEDFELGVVDLARWEQLWPGLAERFITRRLSGLSDFERLMENPAGDIKTVIEVG